MLYRRKDLHLNMKSGWCVSQWTTNLFTFRNISCRVHNSLFSLPSIWYAFGPLKIEISFLDDFSTISCHVYLIDASYFCLYLMLNLMYILMELCSLGLFWSSSGFWLDLQIHSLILWSPYRCMLYKFSAIWNFNRNIAFFHAEKRLQLPLPRSDHPKYIFVWSL